MREIKFRAWDKHMNKMADKEYFQITFNGILIDGTPSTNQEDYVVMQYTGLKDKNGKEIYEGDIAMVDLRPTLPWCMPSVIEFAHGRFRYNQDHIRIPLADVEIMSITSEHEVIGNIYENPELLED